MLTKGFKLKTESECGLLWNHGYSREVIPGKGGRGATAATLFGQDRL